MKIRIAKDYDQMSTWAAEIVAQEIKEKNDLVLGLATGSTPEGLYRLLVQMYQEGTLDFSKVITFNLDEYLGLAPTHPQSYAYFMHQHLFAHINIKAENIHLPDGLAKDLPAFCREYEEKIAAAGGIDLQILGIGRNGHIGFNEPNDYLSAGTHVVSLTEETIDANSRFFNSKDEVPRQAVTMGMGTILKAKKILLMANGKTKAEAIKGTLSGKITTKIPASFLQLHRDLTVIIDEEAASLL
ncbi:MAG: glucosamine-6-phosphate deaminase [Firmicutes bacterium]|nr:glucosamine-6-phosphate deaminase [Bacillota bacterium]